LRGFSAMLVRTGRNLAVVGTALILISILAAISFA
jgi:hypothetical protein